MLDPKLQINHTTNTGIDTWAMGSMMMNSHDGVNKCISHETVLEYHNVAQQMVKDYHSAISRSVEKDIKIPLPPEVTLNDHNITDVHKAIYQTYGWENNDENMIRAVSSDFDSIKAPFSFRNVPSLTGKNDAFNKETRNKL